MNPSQTTKRFLWAGGWVLSVLAASGIGLWFVDDAFRVVISTDYLTRELEQAIQTQDYLELLDKGSSEKARQTLSHRMDLYILTVASHSEHTASDKDREATNRFLRRVAEHRKKHETAYPGLSSGELREFQARIAEILKSKESNK